MRGAFWRWKTALQVNYAYHTGATRLGYPPLLVSLEPTNHCNLRCPMCPVSQAAEKPEVRRGFMDDALFRDIVRELAVFQPVIAFNIGGESTLHPRIVEMVRTMSGAGLAVRFDTNATKVDEKLARGLMDSGLSEIYFCLDGDSRESYEVMRARARFDQVVDNIRTFLRIRRERGRGPRVIVKNIRFYRPGARKALPPNYRELFADCPPDEYRLAWADYWPGAHRYALKHQYEAPPVAAEELQPCVNLWTKLAIGWNGVVYICCLDLDQTIPLIDVKAEGVLGAWNCAAMQDLRRLHATARQQEIPLCSNCNQIRRTSPLPTALQWVSISREGGQGGEHRSDT